MKTLTHGLLAFGMVTTLCACDESDPFTDFYDQPLFPSMLQAGNFTLTPTDQQVLGKAVRIGGQLTMTTPAEGGLSGTFLLFEDGFERINKQVLLAFACDTSGAGCGAEESPTNFIGSFGDVPVSGSISVAGDAVKLTGLENLVITAIGVVTELQLVR